MPCCLRLLWKGGPSPCLPGMLGPSYGGHGGPGGGRGPLPGWNGPDLAGLGASVPSELFGKRKLSCRPR